MHHLHIRQNLLQQEMVHGVLARLHVGLLSKKIGIGAERVGLKGIERVLMEGIGKGYEKGFGKRNGVGEQGLQGVGGLQCVAQKIGGAILAGEGFAARPTNCNCHLRRIPMG